MGNRLFNGVVMLFWLSTMSWLVVNKVLPPLWVGEPPNYRTILDQDQPEPPICWAISLNDRPAGWAVSKVVRRKGGINEIQSRVFVAELPIDQLAPGWLRAIVKPVLTRAGQLDIDAKSVLEIDPLGRLLSFDSAVRIANIPDAVRLHGIIEGDSLKLDVRSGDMSPLKTESTLSPEALVSDAFSPQARLPGLHIGQKWTMPVYSPLRPPNSPMEMLEAIVERDEPIVWNGKSVRTLLVVYRTDSGATLTSEPRGRLWVRGDGLVLRQEMSMFNSHLTFTRLNSTRGQDLADMLEDYKSEEIPAKVNKKMLRMVHAKGIEAS